VKDYGSDIYAEPEPDIDTLANLGPLRRLAGVWTGEHGVDVHPSADGAESQGFVERIELQPIDPQTNGPQLFYGLRYHQHVLRPGVPETFHDQVGYWLWEPATGTVIQSLTIPRGQTALAMGNTTAESSSFELVAHRGSTEYGICSNPFLEAAFQTVAYRIKVTIQDDDHWSYDQTTSLLLKGSQRFEHTDHSTLRRVGPPTPNPLKLKAGGRT
jgi:hypothetical protein